MKNNNFFKKLKLLPLVNKGLKVCCFVLAFSFSNQATTHAQQICSMNNVVMTKFLGDAEDGLGDSTSDNEDNDDFISFANLGSTGVDISGWQLYVDQNGTGSPVFTFPASTILWPYQEVTVVGDWNGSNPLPQGWYDANYAATKGLFEETTAYSTYAILANPNTGEYMSIHNLSSPPTLGGGTLVCDYNFANIVGADFETCELLYLNLSSGNYDFIDGDCSFYGSLGNDTDGDGDGVLSNFDEDDTDPCVPAQPSGYFGYNSSSSTWQAANCDGDLWTNAQEVSAGTDPYTVDVLDTDGDGTPDTTDTDDDGDGVNDADEALVGTDPLDPETVNGTPDGTIDTDGDGIPNGVESNENLGAPTDVAPAEGNPDIITALDTDGDGTPDTTDTDDDGDGVNDADEGLVGTDPLDPQTVNGTPDGTIDTDGDGLPNGDESNENLGVPTDVAPADGSPDILAANDTDGDGIPDTTDTDDDGDGVSDADEALAGTDPLDPQTINGTPDGTIDTDGDGILNGDESDENLAVPTDVAPADGSPDILAANDTDGDGTPDSTDTDDDGDGVNDADEALVGTDPLDPETVNGTPDGSIDTDGDGIPNGAESDENLAAPTDTAPTDGNPDILTGLDTDGDGTPDTTDTDDDGDGVNDADEALVGTNPLDPQTVNGTPDGSIDTDGDGIPNGAESDEDIGFPTDTAPADGNPDILTSNDTDGDGIPDSADTDDDGDGVNDADEGLVGTDPLDPQTVNGTPDGSIDTDGDGIPNADESNENAGFPTDVAPADGSPDILTANDTDGDGIPDATDTDDDGDGVNDADEALVGTDPLDPQTTNGIPDGSIDTDGDGILNADESDEDAAFPTDTAPADGNPDILTSNDTDGDGIPDATDTDDDGDGVNDADEALVGTDPLDPETINGTPDGTLDTDGDGITNADESDEDAAFPTDTAPADGNPDILSGIDTDGDGIPDTSDTDDDGDGVNDADEALVGTDPLDPETVNGVPDGLLDTDGDGIPNGAESDENEAFPTDIAPADGSPDILVGIDTDGDGIPDVTDTDDDGDGVNDADEALVGTDPLDPETVDGTLDGTIDSDGDGIPNGAESDEDLDALTDVAPADGNPDILTGLDTDGDGILDSVDTDDDGDGVNDVDETLVGTDPLDPETIDGTPDGSIDTDGDGIANGDESDETLAFPTDVAPTDNIPDILIGIDTDGDGTPDLLDTDDDGDGVNDSDEALVGTDPLDPQTVDGTPDGTIDTDGDGIPNGAESDEDLAEPTDAAPADGAYDIITGVDTDGDGIPDGTDTDDDGDGVSDVDEALVGTNPLDPQTVNGTPDGSLDTDGDGIPNGDESDENLAVPTDVSPVDGNPDILTALDTDGDGILDSADTDDDGDGVNDADEALAGTDPLDPETINGTPDGSIDTDGDGIPNGDESNENLGFPTDVAPTDGNPDILSGVDTDGDGIPNSLDTDDDGDGVNDADEILVGTDPLDPETINGTPDGSIDTDGDGIPNGEESNDGESFPTDDEPTDGNPDIITGVDTDGDGIPNGSDTDDDGDGVSDVDELLVGTNPLDPQTINGTPDGSLDSDGDGVPNGDESDESLTVPTDVAPADGNPDILTALDTDGDGIPNSVDTDDDDDGVNDADEALVGTDPLDPETINGTPDGSIDSDGDGLLNGEESNENAPFPTDASPIDGNPDIITGLDTDGDGIPDTTDTDDDGDGVNDADEALVGTDPLDPETVNGTPDGSIDSDGDGILNGDESDETSAAPTDTAPLGSLDIITAVETNVDLFPNFTFSNTSFSVGDERMVVININEISGESTNGSPMSVFVPFSAGFTYGYNPTQTSASVIVPQTVNNPDWTMTNTGSGFLFTSNAIIPGGSRSRIAISVKADVAGTNANITVNLTPGSGGDTDDKNNVSVLAQSIQN